MSEVKIDLNNLDKSTWRTYRFDEIVKNISERIDPNNTDLEVYIGLEHIDSESLHIKRHGTPNDVNGQKLKFYKGDIIFGRRRAYQRKAGIATTDGFCSAHALVLRANPEVIDPQLFPFFLHSDLFMNRAVDISVGSLSPTINWGTLKHEEFLLPPKEQQVSFAELFASSYIAIEYNISVLEKAKNTYQSIVNEKCLNIDGAEVLLSEVIDKLEAGVSVNSKEGDICSTDKGILKTSAVSEGFFNPNEAKKVVEGELGRLKTKVRKGSILISRMNTFELVGANAYVSHHYENLYLPDRLWQTSILRKDVISKYIWFVLSSPFFRRKISSLCTGTSNSMKNISQKSFLGLKMILPSKILQEKVVKELELIEGIMDESEKKIKSSKNLHKGLTRQVF